MTGVRLRPEVLVLSPLPCWENLNKEVQRQLVVEMIADIESEAALRRRYPAGSISL